MLLNEEKNYKDVKLNNLGGISFYLPSEEFNQNLIHGSIYETEKKAIQYFNIKYAIYSKINLIDIFSKNNQMKIFGKDYDVIFNLNKDNRRFIIDDKEEKVEIDLISGDNKNSLSDISFYLEEKLRKQLEKKLWTKIKNAFSNSSEAGHFTNDNEYQMFHNFFKKSETNLINKAIENNKISFVLNNDYLIREKYGKLYINVQMIYFNEFLIYNVVGIRILQLLGKDTSRFNKDYLSVLKKIDYLVI